MSFGMYAAGRAILGALYPAWWAFAYQIPIGLLVAYIVFWQQSEDRDKLRTLLTPAAISGGIGSAVYALLAMLPLALTTVIGLVAMWFIVSFTADRYLDIDLDKSNRITAAICVPIWILWLIIGAVFVVLRAS